MHAVWMPFEITKLRNDLLGKPLEKKTNKQLARLFFSTCSALRQKLKLSEERQSKISYESIF